MLYLVLFLLFLLLFLFLFRVYYIIEYDNELTVKIKLMFFKKTVFSSSKIEKIDPINFINNISHTKELVLDLYKKFKGTLRVKEILLDAVAGGTEAHTTAIIYGTICSFFSLLIAFLDSLFSLKENQICSHVVASFREEQPKIKICLTLYTSLFSFILFSTYAFIKNAIIGGKNGRKQAKRNDKNRTRKGKKSF